MNLPREIGSFEILEPLGAGGMGEVFKARDRRLNRCVAIKFMSEPASATARERFQREATPMLPAVQAARPPRSVADRGAPAVSAPRAERRRG